MITLIFSFIISFILYSCTSAVFPLVSRFSECRSRLELVSRVPSHKTAHQWAMVGRIYFMAPYFTNIAHLAI